MMRNHWLVFLLLLTGCASFNSAPPTPDATHPASTPLPATTSTLITHTPARTPSPASTTRPAPISAEGPWLIFGGQTASSDVALYLVDDATRTIHRLTGEDTRLFWRFHAQQPADQGNIIFAEFRDPEVWLNLLSLPEGRVQPITNVLRERGEMDNNTYVEMVNGLTNALNASWNGDRMAFIGALDGPSTDVYLYEAGSVRRLTDEPELTNELYWSPDGATLVYGLEQGFFEDFCGGVFALYAINPDGGEAVRLTPQDTVEARFIGWKGSHTAIIITRPDDSCVWTAVHEVDVLTGALRTLWEGEFTNAAYDPATDSALLTQGGSQYYARSNPDTEKPSDAVLLRNGAARPLGLDVYEAVIWSEPHQMFLMRSDTDLVGVTPSGQVNSYPAPDGFATMAMSPDGEWIIWDTIEETFISAWGENPQPWLDDNVWMSSWVPGGNGVYFSDQTALYYAEPPGFEPVFIDNVHYSESLPSSWITP